MCINLLLNDCFLFSIMPERTRKRKTRVENEGNKQTYSQKLKKRMTKSEERLKVTEVKECTGSVHIEDEDHIPLTNRLVTMVTNNGVCEKRVDDDFPLFGFQPRENVPNIHGFTPLEYKSQNLVHYLQQYSRGQKATVCLKKVLYMYEDFIMIQQL